MKDEAKHPHWRMCGKTCPDMPEMKWLRDKILSDAQNMAEYQCRAVEAWFVGEKIASRANGALQKLPDGAGGSFYWFGDLADHENNTRVAHFWFRAEGTTLRYGLNPFVPREKVLSKATE